MSARANCVNAAGGWLHPGAKERAAEYMDAFWLDPAALARFFGRVSKIGKQIEIAVAKAACADGR